MTAYSGQINFSQTYPGGGTVVSPLIVYVGAGDGDGFYTESDLWPNGGASSTLYKTEGAGARKGEAGACLIIIYCRRHVKKILKKNVKEN